MTFRLWRCLTVLWHESYVLYMYLLLYIYMYNLLTIHFLQSGLYPKDRGGRHCVHTRHGNCTSPHFSPLSERCCIKHLFSTFSFPTQAKDTVRMSNASTIHVVDEEVTGWRKNFFGPWCIFFSPDYNLNNDNHGYVDDVDDPRHD